MVGASGAIFGLFAVALVFVRELRLQPQALIGTIVINFVLTFTISSISKLGHVGGFVTGALIALAIRLTVQAARRRPTRPAPRVLALQQSAAMAVLLAVLIAITAWRTATYTL